MKYYNKLIILLCTILLVSCADKPPSCDDSNTIEILKNIINKELDKKITDKNKFNEIKSSGFIKFEKIKNNGYSEKEEKFTCAADAVISFNINSNSETIKKITEILKISNSVKLDGSAGGFAIEMIDLQMTALGLEKITSISGVSIINSEIFIPITYSSYYVTNSSKEKQTYVESNGLPPLINAAHNVYKLHITGLETEKLKSQSTEKTNTAIENLEIKKKMMGDVVDSNPNAEPNTPEDKVDKKNNKTWKDNGGIMHFPDGSASSTSVD